MAANTAQKAITAAGTGPAKEDRTPRGVSINQGFWQRVVEKSAIGIALVDLGGRILAANATCRKLLGLREEQFRTLPFLNIVHKDAHEAGGSLVQELLKGTRQQIQIEKCQSREDGSQVRIRYTVSLVPGEGGVHPL